MLCFSKRRKAITEERKLHDSLMELLKGHTAWQEDLQSPAAIAYEASAKEACRQCYLLLCKSKPYPSFPLKDGSWDAQNFWFTISEMQLAVQRGIWSDVCNALEKMVYFQKITQPMIHGSVTFLLGQSFGCEDTRPSQSADDVKHWYEYIKETDIRSSDGKVLENCPTAYLDFILDIATRVWN